MIQQKYGRDQELESDKYGMKYMKKAGYDPTGAVTLQETFVRLASQGEQKEADWFEGLFASHPPSAERVAENKKTAAELGVGGETGTERYVARLKPLMDMKPAYDKYDEAVAAARKGETPKAKSLVAEAIKLVPNEGRFHQLQGEIALSEKKPQEAVASYQKAIDLNPNYFGSYLGAGVAQYRAGDQAKAEQYLTQSAKLLPTAPAAYFLGNLARDKGDDQSAVKYYQAAASSNSDIGKAAAAELVKLDLPQNPGNYLATGPQLASDGRLVLVIENRAPLALTDIQVTPVLVDAQGNIVQQARPVRVPQALKPGERVSLDAGVGAVPQQQLDAVRFRVDSARIAENTAK
jgi:predicted Zn-dependent protease